MELWEDFDPLTLPIKPLFPLSLSQSLKESLQMISHSQTHLLSQTPPLLSFSPTSSSSSSSSLTLNTNLSNLRFPQTLSLSRSRSPTPMSINSKLSNGIDTLQLDLPQQSELDRIAQVANTVADAAGEVIRKYFRNKFEILDKEDQSKPFFWVENSVGLLFFFEENEKR